MTSDGEDQAQVAVARSRRTLGRVLERTLEVVTLVFGGIAGIAILVTIAVVVVALIAEGWDG